MQKKTKALVALGTIASLALDTHAFLDSERTLVVSGSHSAHTVDDEGFFRHPFANEDPEVEAIHYTDAKTISLRLRQSDTFSTKLLAMDEGVDDQGSHEESMSNKEHSLVGRVKQWLGFASAFQLDETAGLYNKFPSGTGRIKKKEIIYYDIPLKNHYDLQYTAKVYIGNPVQEVNAIWDTGSSKLLLETEVCDNCIGQVFHTADSKTFSQDEPAQPVQVTYADGTELKGSFASERVCPTDNLRSCADDFRFVALEEQSGLHSSYDGIMGMWHGGIDPSETLFVPYLQSQGVISSKMFSFYLSAKGNESFIDFGTPNTSIMTHERDIVWLDVISEIDQQPWWTNKINGIRWDDKMGNEVLALEETSAFTDTGTSCIMGPKYMVDYIKNSILNLLPAYENNIMWGQLFKCSYRSELPTFSFLFGNHWFEVRPEDYAVQVTLSGKCALCLQERTGSDHWVLGAAFLRGWYSIHDHENDRFGFVPQKESPRLVPQLELTMPSTQLPEVSQKAEEEKLIFGLTVGTFLTAAAVGIIFAAMTGLVIIYCLPSKKEVLVFSAVRSGEPTRKSGTRQESPDTLIVLL